MAAESRKTPLSRTRTKTASAKPAAKKPAAKKPAAKKSAAKEPASKKPAMKKPTESPAAPRARGAASRLGNGRPPTPPLPVEGPFAEVTAALAHAPLVTLEPGWGRENLALKRAGKIVAMLVRSALVVKLPRPRVDALVAEGKGERFDPRKDGRAMKEWLVVEEGVADWVALAEEALAFAQAAATR